MQFLHRALEPETRMQGLCGRGKVAMLGMPCLQPGVGSLLGVWAVCELRGGALGVIVGMEVSAEPTCFKETATG